MLLFAVKNFGLGRFDRLGVSTAVEEPVSVPVPRVVASTLLAAVLTAGAGVSPPAAGAEPAGGHQVRYSVSATQTAEARIYYREVQPPDFGAYSHNPYEYSPRADATVGPDQPWIFETALADPQDWAMVVVSLPPHHEELETPGYVCELRVDDVVVSTDAGTRGALCSLRTW